jgi:hypothetical protein
MISKQLQESIYYIKTLRYILIPGVLIKILLQLLDPLLQYYANLLLLGHRLLFIYYTVSPTLTSLIPSPTAGYYPRWTLTSL